MKQICYSSKDKMLFPHTCSLAQLKHCMYFSTSYVFQDEKTFYKSKHTFSVLAGKERHMGVFSPLQQQSV